MHLVQVRLSKHAETFILPLVLQPTVQYIVWVYMYTNAPGQSSYEITA